MMRKRKTIDNKGILMTEDEYKYFKDICRSLDSQDLKGEDYFRGLFEVDSEGYLTFLHTPRNKFISVEAYMFLMNLMVHQHLDSAVQEVLDLKRELLADKKELQEVLALAKSQLTKE